MNANLQEVERVIKFKRNGMILKALDRLDIPRVHHIVRYDGGWLPNAYGRGWSVYRSATMFYRHGSENTRKVTGSEWAAMTTTYDPRRFNGVGPVFSCRNVYGNAITKI